MVALVKEEQVAVRVSLKISLSEQIKTVSNALKKEFKGLQIPKNYRIQFIGQKLTRNGRKRELIYRIFWEIGSMSTEEGQET